MLVSLAGKCEISSDKAQIKSETTDINHRDISRPQHKWLKEDRQLQDAAQARLQMLGNLRLWPD